LALLPGETVLDIGCGSGQLSRRLAALGADVTGVDAAPTFVARAQARAATLPTNVASRLRYKVADATDAAQIAALGGETYDAVVSTMALMDIADIAPLFGAAARLLKPGGRFVVVTAHPVLHSSENARTAELVERNGALHTEYSLRLWRYRTAYAMKGVGAVGEPEPHWYFHRALTDLLTPAFAAGLVMDALEEPVYPSDTVRNFHSFGNFPEFPPTLAFRLRLR
jgi:2-polyprenyl-3-methyl-5-hydroxy-6-metoxy-1,4-benzoquinol methylase